MTENWTKIKNYSNYSCNRNGQIRNDFINRFFRSSVDPEGYLIVTLRENGIRKNFKVHRIIAETFIPNPDNKPTVNHINKNKDDNRVENLEWSTYSEQMSHQYKSTNKKIIKKERSEFTNQIGEIWEIITANYYVSNFGKLRNGKYLISPSIKRGYYCYIIQKKFYLIHRLVAEKFIDNPNKYKIVNHKDGNKINNHYTNLEWCTAKDNVKHAIENSLISTIKKIVHYDNLNNIINIYNSAPEAAKALDIKSYHICDACKGKCNVYDKNKNKLNFKYLEDDDDIINKKISIKNLPKKEKVERIKVYHKINVYDRNGNLLETCKNNYQASKIYKVKTETILKHCEGKVKYPTGDYKFSYAIL